ncbi:MAG: transcriptional regulator [Acidobacteria bacterium]|nr:transcriptional regulator [Acidobacteriota bacterium]
MITEAELLALLRDPESYRVERTVSTTDTAKFSQAVCAFSNDMPGSRLPGYLLVGASDKGDPSGLKVTDAILQNLAALASDGNILPSPAIVVEKVTLSSGEGDIAVVEVQPSPLPPVRFRGQTWIRRGPRRAIASDAEESILIERRTAAARTFDAQPCAGADLHELALSLFTNTYRPLAVDAETIAESHRPVEHQLAALRFFDLPRNCPTYAGLIVLGKDVLRWLPNSYVQFVRYGGITLADEVHSENEFRGDLLTLVRDLSAFVKLMVGTRPVRVSALEERRVADYPETAVRELLMNAVLHRSYELPAPIRFYEFSDARPDTSLTL